MSENSPVLAGFDAGQTQCRCRLSRWTNGHLELLGEGSGPGISHLDAAGGPERFRSAIGVSLRNAWKHWQERSPQETRPWMPLTAAAIGASGLEAGSTLQSRGGALLAAELQLPESRCLATGDERTALRGAFPHRAGIVLISGTGMIVVGRDHHGREHRAGGWGWRLDGAGSAFDIGHQALQMTVRMADGRAADGALRSMLWDALGCRNACELKALVVHPDHGVADEARLAPLVDDIARGGDAAANAILQQSASVLAEAAAATARALALNAPSLAARGGALQNLPLCRHQVETAVETLIPGSRWQASSGDACDGALAFALDRVALRPH